MNDQIREALKTILTTDMTGDSKGGLMQPEQAKKFLDLTLDYSSMLKVVRVDRKTARAGETDTINVGDVVTEGSTQAPGDGSSPDEEKKPTFGKVEYSLKKLRSMFDISTETLLDNVESEGLFDSTGGIGGQPPPVNFRDKLMGAYAKRISGDVEYLAIAGDETIDGSSTKTERLLKTNDGWHVLTATGCHYVDCAFKGVSSNLFAAMLESIPAPYLKRMGDLRWFVSPRTKIRWDKKVADRLTSLGDQALQGAESTPFGIPMIMVPMIPEDLTFDDGTTTASALSFIWLTFPENFIWVVRRNVETYWEFKPRADKWENTTYTETDQTLENPDAIVKAINLKVDASTDY